MCKGFRGENLLLLTLFLTMRSTLSAAEIQLRPTAHPKGAVVTLGDVADVVSADRHQVDALATIELFPAPSAGRPRFLRARIFRRSWPSGKSI